MTLKFQNRSRFLDLHGSTGLTDWDMDEEMKLTTTTDQFGQDDKLNDQYLAQWHYARISRRKGEYICHNQKSESFFQSNLWLMVNPNLACPIQYIKKAANPPTLSKHPVELQTRRDQPAGTRPLHRKLHTSTDDLHSVASSTVCMVRDDEGASWSDVYQPAQTRRKGRKTRDGKVMKLGGWSRPPVNYCILIAMALSSSHTGSLNVQQIYNFTREHFPFFQTAPDGWKNTIRHNLCFSNSFRKTPHQLCRDGKRKSCLWHLTLDGRRRLRDEIHTLTAESFKDLKRSMSRPDVIQALFEL